MKSVAVSLLFLLPATLQAVAGWEKKAVDNVSIEVPSDCQHNVQHTPGGGAVQKMKRHSFRNRVLSVEVVFLSFAPGTEGNLDGAAANMSAQLRAAPGAEGVTRWKMTTVSGRAARRLAAKLRRIGQGRHVTLVDDTKAKNQLVIVDISYDAKSGSGESDAERITKSVALK